MSGRSVSGTRRGVMGPARAAESGSGVGYALDIVRRNPLPVLLVAAGVGWLMYRITQEGRTAGAMRASALEEESIPVLNIGHARVYDPDMSPRHPTHDLLDSRREISARA